MLTQSGGKVNDFSRQLRDKLEEASKSMQNRKGEVKFKFAIARKNPDGAKTGGEWLYPSLYTLQPVTFDITDPFDGKRKKVGIALAEDDNGNITDWGRVTLGEREVGIKTLKMTKADDRDTFAYLMLHPCSENPLMKEFRDDQRPILFGLMDEVAAAKKRTADRSMKHEAIAVAVSMGAKQEIQFADALGWEEGMDPDMRKDKIMDLVETDPKLFTELMESNVIQIRAAITKAERLGLINWLPAENKWNWANNGDTMIAFGRQPDMDKLKATADWMYTGGKKGEQAYETIVNLLKIKKAESVPA